MFRSAVVFGFYVSLICIVLACSREDSQLAMLSGAIVNTNNTPLEYTYFREYLNNDRVVIALEPSDDSGFSVSLQLEKPLMGWLRAGRVEVPVYLEPGNKLHIEGNAERLRETIVFSGRGSNHNNFLAAYYNEIESVMGGRHVASLAGNLNPDQFITILDSITDKKLLYLDTWQQDAPFAPEFDLAVRTQILYEQYTMLLEYPLMYQRANNLKTLPELPVSYYAFLNNEKLFDDSRLENLTYTNFLLAYINHVHRLQAPANNGHSINQQIFHTAKKSLNGRSRDFIRALMVGRELSYGAMEEAQDLYGEYITGDVDYEYKSRVIAIYENMEQLAKGNPAPQFTMTDIHGKNISLSDFLGKVVILDFWASWCGPCMREMPHMKAIKQEMADQQDLIFMYISIDTDVEAWKNTVERAEIDGIHFNTPGRERGVPAMYNVKWIPGFFIIGRDGTIFDNRPPMPSSGQLQDLLKQALAETDNQTSQHK